MATLVNKIENILGVSLDDSTRAKIEEVEIAGEERGLLKADILETLLDEVNTAADNVIDKASRN